MMNKRTGKYLLALGAIMLLGLGIWALKPNSQNPVTLGPIKADRAVAKQITVYKSASCGCCVKWNDYLRKAKYQVTAHNTDRLADYKTSVGVPEHLQSCHTAIIDGYVIEGHVPLREIEKLLSEKPDAIGLSIPGMVSGSPGMENSRFDSYDVILFYKDGRSEVYASY